MCRGLVPGNMYKLGPILLLCFCALCQCVFSNADLPKIDSSELQSGQDVTDSLSDSGGRLGAFAITGLGQDYVQALSTFRASLGECLRSKEDLPEIGLDPTDKQLLRRRTLAAATSADGAIGDVEFPLECAGVSALSAAMDKAEEAVAKLVKSAVGRKLEYKSPGDHTATSLTSAPRKDHLHLYYRNGIANNNQEEDSLMVPFHVDNGLYLLVTPTKDSPLIIWQSDGTPASTEGLPDDSLIVLFGRGLTEWMLQDEYSERSLFWATPHAVPTLANEATERAVYARMKVAPGEAIPTLSPSLVRRSSPTLSFNDVFLHSTSPSSPSSSLCDPTLSRWTRSAKEQCDEGFEYCWMSCLPLPEEDCDAVCENENGRPCGDNDMDATCHWTCPSTTTTMPPATTDSEGDGGDNGGGDGNGGGGDVPVWSDFCNGASDMLMLGFDVSGKENNPCVILFFKSWTLDEPWKFALGCVGVCLLGVGAEALIWYRRYRQNQVYTDSKFAWMFVEILCYASSLMLGYMAMLVAMTYSVELFLSVCIGLVVGHVIFNLSAPVGETADPCCQASQNPNGSHLDRKCRSDSINSGSGGCNRSDKSLPSYNSGSGCH